MTSDSLPHPAVLIEDVAFSYRPGPEVLRIPAFRIERGERIFLFGPSGSGKTTLLGLIAGVLRVTHGTLRVLDEDFARMSNRERDTFRGSQMGYIFQLFNLITYLSVLDNITLPCRLNRARRMRLSGDLNSAAKQMASGLGIETLLQEEAASLSVGQQQRVAAARALLGSPELVIADEPTSSLDVDQRERFIRVLFESCRQTGSTLIVVSHDHGLAPLFDRTVSLTELNEARL